MDSPRDKTDGEALTREDLVTALRDEYADVLAQRGSWRWHGSHTTEPEALRLPYLRGARDALLYLATRLGVDDLIARAAEVVARPDGGQEERP